MSEKKSVSAQESLERLRGCYSSLRERISEVIVGQDEALRDICAGLVCGGHMLLVGVPGLAKTLMVKTLSDALGWKFHRIQFTPDLMPADITGTEILQTDEAGMRRDMVFRKGPIFANLLLADEINRTPPKTQAALLEAMQEYSVTCASETYLLPRPFVVVATQNPIEHEGTYPLPEAQLDRFMLSIHIDYPQIEQEIEIASRPMHSTLTESEPVARAEDYENFRQIIEQAPVSRHVAEYAVRICASSRPGTEHADSYVKKYVGWGAGPRASQYLILAAKSLALIEGRPAPEISDIRAMALPVLRHRLIVNYNALGDGLAPEDMVRHLLDNVKEPG